MKSIDHTLLTTSSVWHTYGIQLQIFNKILNFHIEYTLQYHFIDPICNIHKTFDVIEQIVEYKFFHRDAIVSIDFAMSITFLIKKYSSTDSSKSRLCFEKMAVFWTWLIKPMQLLLIRKWWSSLIVLNTSK